mgnify:CR=1 FL=1
MRTLADTGTELLHSIVIAAPIEKVWAELRRIPYGETASYGEIARRIGRPEASRAVGMARP